MVEVVAPWAATVALTTGTAPQLKTMNRYNVSSGGYTVTLPPLSSVPKVGARLGIEKDRLDASANAITVQRSGADAFDDLTTSFTMSGQGQQEILQVVLIGGVRYWKRFSGGGVSAGGVTATSADNFQNKTLTAPKFADLGFIADTNGNELLVFDSVASAVNAIQITNSTAGAPVIIQPAGSDTNINLWLNGYGSGKVFLNGGHQAVTVDEPAVLSQKQIVARVVTAPTNNNATPAINTDVTDIYVLPAQTVNITSFTANLTGTPGDGDLLRVLIKGTASRTLAWGAKFVASSIALPTTTSGTVRLTVGFQYDLAAAVWQCVLVT